MIDQLLDICALRNASVRESLETPDLSLDGFLETQADKVRHNCTVKPLRDPGDYFECLSNQAVKLAGRETAAEILRVVQSGRAICTADHHGAIFCSQSFQGDILYAHLLEKLDMAVSIVPVMSAGQVELENATYARGICAYAAMAEKQLFPLFPAKYSVTLASHAPVVNAEMIERFRKRFVRGEGRDGVQLDPDLTAAFDEILRKGFESPTVQKQTRFADQITGVGTGISGSLFEGESPVFVYLENEEVVMPLLLTELEDPESLICRILCDPTLRDAVVHTAADEDAAFGGLLFRAVDEKGRKILLSLSEEGMLTGHDWHGAEVCYSAEPGELAGLIRERKVFPGTFTLALLTFFERGITWLGGMFQSVYLPEWQRGFVRLLAGCGFQTEADTIAAYDCSGYISGPMFALYRIPEDADGRRGATGAGPVEFMRCRPAWKRMAKMLRSVRLADAHRIGLAEMYFDLVLREERVQDWYETIAKGLAERYGEEEVYL